jgi:hypothetical protein
MNKILTRLTSFICVLALVFCMAPVSFAEESVAPEVEGNSYVAEDTVDEEVDENQDTQDEINQKNLGVSAAAEDVDTPEVTEDTDDDSATITGKGFEAESKDDTEDEDEAGIGDIESGVQETNFTFELSEYNLPYTGNVITVTVIEPKYNGVALKDNEYEVHYMDDHTNAGTKQVRLIGKGDYQGHSSEPLSYTITPANISTCVVSPVAAVTYTGSAQTPAVTVTFNGKTLVAGTDYAVSYSNNVNAGQATAIITGKGNFTGTTNAFFTINKANQSITVSPNPVKVDYHKTKTLKVSGSKGSLSYKSAKTSIATVSKKGKITGKKVGKTTITVTAAATANYNAASVSVPVTVKGKELKASTTKIKLSKTKYTYDGKAKKPSVTVKYKGKKLKKNKDYKVSYENNKNAGKATVIVTGKNQYEGTRKVKFTIQKAKNPLKATIDDTTILPKEKAYIKVKKSKGEVTFESNDTSVATVNKEGVVTGKNDGKATITVTAAGDVNYKKATVKFKVEVGYHYITDKACSVKLSKTSYNYDGDYKRPTVTVKYDGVTLKQDRDYTVSYSDNLKPGTASVTVKGKGKYRGTRVLTFKITNQKKEQTNFTASIKNNTIPLNGTATVFVSGARGKVTFSCKSPSYAEYIGDATFRGLKKTKDGITIVITAAGDDTYKSKTIELWVSVK